MFGGDLRAPRFRTIRPRELRARLRLQSRSGSRLRTRDFGVPSHAEVNARNRSPSDCLLRSAVVGRAHLYASLQAEAGFPESRHRRTMPHNVLW